MNKKLLITLFVIGTCFMLSAARTNTITCDEDESETTQGCCYVDGEEMDYAQLDPEYECSGFFDTTVALPTNWADASIEQIKAVIEDNLSEDWLMFFNGYRCANFPGCAIAEIAEQADGIYGLRCRTCMSGYRPTDLGLCEECTVTGCEECADDVDVCTKCYQGLFIGTGGLVCADIDNCVDAIATDATAGDCTECMDTYYRDGEGDCQPCDTGYYTCSDIDVGIECDDEYFLNNAEACVYIQNCEFADPDHADNEECETCVSNSYYVDAQGDCVLCSTQTGFVTCSSSSVALSCDEDSEYFLATGGACVQLEYCITASEASAAQTECDVCDDSINYFANEAGTCAYIANCLESDAASASNGECDLCDDSDYYFAESDGSCVEIDNCKESAPGSADSNECDVCDDSEYYFVNEAGVCVEIDNCIESAPASAENNQCDECDESEYYFVNEAGTCVEINNCIQTTPALADNSRCVICDDSEYYFAEQNGICVEITGCSESAPSSAENNDCDICDTANHYFLTDNFSCVELEFCQSSDEANATAGECESCVDEEYIFLDSDGVCQYISNCQVADEDSALLGECDTCDDGYWNDAGDCTYCDIEQQYTFGIGNICYEIVGCEEASDADKALENCTTCEDGYYLDASGDCIECPQNVAKCSDATTFIQCDPGYNLIGGQCRQIDDCCIASYDAQASPTTTCTQCQPSYYVSSGQCVEVDDCAVVSPGDADTDATCTQCVSGYKLNTGACDYCGVASDQVDQTECEDCGFVWYQDQCVNAMPYTCIITDETTSDCILCNYGLNWNSTSMLCEPCDTLVADYWEGQLDADSALTELDSCTFTDWTAPDLPADGGDAGDAADNGDSAFTMLFNIIALIVLSLLAFFLV